MVTSTVIDDKDSSIQYVGTWILGGSKNEYNSSIHGSVSVGAHAIFKFVGSSVAVFGTLEAGVARTPTSSYSIDGSPATLFKGVPPENASISHHLYYKSPDLDPSKEHTLVITLTNTAGNTFWFDFLRYVNADVPVSAPSPPSPQSTPPANQAAPSSTAMIPSSLNPITQSLPTQVLLPPSLSTAVSAQLSQKFSSLDPSASIQSMSGDKLDSSPPPSNSSASSIFLGPAATTATTAQNQSQTHGAHGLSTGTIVGIAVGSTAGALVLFITVFVFFYILRRRARERKSLSSSRRVTAFSLRTERRDAEDTPTSEVPSGRLEWGTGYIIRGGLSEDKAVNSLPSSNDRRQTGDRSHVFSDVLPDYQSVLDDGAPALRPSLGKQ